MGNGVGEAQGGVFPGFSPRLTPNYQKFFTTYVKLRWISYQS